MQHRVPNVYQAIKVSKQSKRHERALGFSYCSSMPHARIIPNGSRTLRPVHASDAVMVVCDQAHDIVTDHLVFIIIYVVDSSHVEADSGKDTLPPCLAICAHDGVDGREGIADVEG